MKPESVLSAKIAAELDWRLPPEVYATAIGHGSRRFSMAVTLKQMGVRGGVPDWLIVYGGHTHFIELKLDGYPSKQQRECHEDLRKAGARVAVCRSLETFLDQLRSWSIPLNETRPEGELNDAIGF